jgi:hypothetical protein
MAYKAFIKWQEQIGARRLVRAKVQSSLSRWWLQSAVSKTYNRWRATVEEQVRRKGALLKVVCVCVRPSVCL